jgi:sirohydrochlorin cobaltochelatase
MPYVHLVRSVCRVAIALAVTVAFSPRLIAQSSAGGAPDVGVLIMAHGGTPEWDGAVVQAIQSVRGTLPTALALGMADPTTMQAALDSLSRAGVETIAVVRLFLSGESFLQDTEFYLGLRDDPSPMAGMMMHGGDAHAGHGAHAGPPSPLEHSAEILLERRGLSEAPVASSIVLDRAMDVSIDPARESVIVVAHGMGDEGENQRVLDNMAASVETLRGAGFGEVHAATLREDWPEARAVAEAEIRDWVATRAARGDRVIVVPYRLFGFGGYAEVLEGLTYVPADGLLPHDLVSTWIEDSAASLFCGAGVEHPLGRCMSSR